MTNNQYDSPHMSKWVVSVDWKGNVSVIEAPRLLPRFLNFAIDAQDLGLPDCVYVPAGLYEWECSFTEDGWEFEVVNAQVLWK